MREVADALIRAAERRENLYSVYEMPDGTRHLSPYVIRDREAMMRELAEQSARNQRIRQQREGKSDD